MKILIAGSRHTSPAAIEYARRAVRRAHELGASLICGDAPGIDETVIDEADRIGVPITVYAPRSPRNASKQGGVLIMGRNYTERDRIMIQNADVCLFIWNGRSNGTKTGYEYAVKLGKNAHIRTP